MVRSGRLAIPNNVDVVEELQKCFRVTKVLSSLDGLTPDPTFESQKCILKFGYRESALAIQVLKKLDVTAKVFLSHVKRRVVPDFTQQVV